MDGALIDSSTTANFKGSAYPADEQAINRLRVGLVSEGGVSDTNTLYFDDVVVSKVGTTTSADSAKLVDSLQDPGDFDDSFAFAATETIAAESIGHIPGTEGQDWLLM